MSNTNYENASLPIQTETMAELLLNQRHWREAIDIYHKLSIQNPDKRPFFQKKITEIKEYFKPQSNPEADRKRLRTQRKIEHLKKLLRTVKN